MKKFLVLFACALALSACQPKTIAVGDHLSTEEQASLMYDLSRYLCHIAPGADHSTKFNAEFDSFYQKEALKLKPQFYYSDKSGRTYFLVTRIAPSIHEKYVATGGYFNRASANGEFVEYKEVFRTWKDLEPALLPKAELLFREMIAQKDLSQYYTENAGTEYIEFPDSETYYDEEQRIWISTRENRLQEMKDTAAKQLREAGDAVRAAKDSTNTPSEPE